jgi:proteasome lid subunit RPN8/RPN11
MTLRITYAVHASMVEHCRREAPREACGLLGGAAPRATTCYPMRNIARDAERRYDADPKDLIAAVQDMRANGTEILAIYHSHPKWRAEPSTSDLALNYYEDVPRIIVGLLDPTNPDVRVWRLSRRAYQELPWKLVPVADGCLGD